MAMESLVIDSIFMRVLGLLSFNINTIFFVTGYHIIFTPILEILEYLQKKYALIKKTNKKF